MKEFITELKKSGLLLKLKDNDLILSGLNGKLSKSDIARIKEDKSITDFIKTNKNDLIAYLSKVSSAKSNGKLNRDEVSSIYELSPLQEGLLFHGLYDRSSTAYLNQITMDFPEGLDVAALKSSWNYLIKNHSILRTGFIYDKVSIPIQCVYHKVELPFEIIDLSAYTETEKEAKYSEIIVKDKQSGFDFSKAPLIRITLVKMNADSYRMIWTRHHILWDGWSAQVIMEELLSAYEAYTKGETPPAIAEDKYEDYIKYINAQNPYEEEKFWKEYMEGFDDPSLIPFVGNTKDRNKGKSVSKLLSLEFDEAKTDKIKNFAQASQITVNTLLQGVWAFLLSKYTGKSDTVFGVTVSGRPSDIKFENKVGLYINTLPFRSSIDPEEAIITWLTKLQKGHISARKYEYSALNKIQNWINVKGDLFDSILVLKNFPLSEAVQESNWSLKIDNLKVSEHNNFLLSLDVSVRNNISVHFNFNSTLLDTSYVDQIKAHFQQVMEEIVFDGKEKLSEINMLSEVEKDQLQYSYSHQNDYPKEASIVARFEAQVEENPDAVAIVFEGETFTYAQANEKANQIAVALKESYDIQSNDVVGIMMKNSEWSVITIMGILKAGATYVPIDVELPMERKAFLVKDTGLKVLMINSENLFDVIDLRVKAFSVDLQIDEFEAANYTPTNINAEDPAYFIYTSGSTGQPKGVIVTHQNIMDYYYGLTTTVDLAACQSFGLMSTLSADLGNTVLFGALLSGKTLHVFTKKSLTDAAYLHDYFAQQPIDCIKIVPSHWRALTLDDKILRTQRMIIFGGEVLPLSLVEKIKRTAPNLQIINHYGPTETTIGKLLHQVDFNKRYTAIPIGQPFSNTKIYVVNQDLSLCPVGVAGELLIGGDGVAKGYWNRAELTATKFIENIFDKKDTSKLYRTGDLVRRLPDGNIEFVGRIDDQVKIRGFRIELGEIEKELEKASVIRQAVVIAKDNKNGSGKRLVAYVIPEASYDNEEFRNYIKERLPDYMIPAQWIELDEMPLTSNGKINKKALPDADSFDHQSVTTYVAPENETQEKLIAIWSNLLEVERIGIYDDFFELGGHSLLAIRVVSAIRKDLNVEISIADLFDYITVSELAEFVETQATKSNIPPMVTGERPEKIPLSFSQERLWFIDKLQGSTNYHIPIVRRIKGTIDVEMLQNAFRSIVNRHEILRTKYIDDEGQAYQEVLAENEWQLELHDMADQDKAALDQEIRQTIEMPFDLSSDHMLRAKLIAVNVDEYILIIVCHHIASDGWSAPIFINELLEFYQAQKEGRSAQLSALDVQYADYAIWQRGYLKDEVLEEKLQYWEDNLKDVDTLNLPLDFNRPAIQSTVGKQMHFDIDDKLLNRLNALAQEEDVTLYMLLMAAYNVLLYRYAGQEDICIGSPVANRTSAEVESLIGFFINTLPLRMQVKGTADFQTLLQEVKATTLAAYEYQDVPFERIVDRVIKNRNQSQSPIFQTMFVLQNNPEVKTVLLDTNVDQDTTIEPEPVGHFVSKYDLTLELRETDQGLRGNFEYCTDLFMESSIRRMSNHYIEILREVVAQKDIRLDKIKMLRPEEAFQLVEAFNDTAVPYPMDKTFVDLFEEQVEKNPAQLAILFGTEEMSYAALNEKANQLANYLRVKGVKNEDIVAICMERSVEMVITILGVLKTGAAFLPIDANYPAERIQYILEHSNTKYLMSQMHLNALDDNTQNEQVIFIDREWLAISGYPTANPQVDIRPDNLAYVIYTSGSTGRPKGIQLEHAGALNMGLGQVNTLGIQSSDRFLRFASVSFDAAVLEMYTTFLAGATMVLIDDSTIKNPDAFVKYLKKHEVSVAILPPSYLHILDKDELCATLRIMKTAGEAAITEDALYCAQRLDYYNAYGPSECTVCSTLYKVTGDEPKTKPIPIGKPVENMQIYVLDNNYLPVPTGVEGGIYIAGVGLARGYLHNEELTAEKFVDNPFVEGTKMYYSGDRGKWDAQGNLIFLGRDDNQVKVRGHRIELDEVESILMQSDKVSQGVVMVKELHEGDKVLVAYVIPEGAYDEEGIKAHMRSHLPAYMIPTLMMEIDHLPLTQHGKINKKMLPEPDASMIMTKEYIAPRNEREEQLSAIWRDLLKLEKIGIYDNFFDLGGHSLLAARMIARINKELSIEIPIRVLFEYNCIADLGEYLLLMNMTVESTESASEMKYKVIDF